MNQETLSLEKLGNRNNASYETHIRDLEIRFATSHADLQECFRLRHQVYCVENDYEPRRRGHQPLETDAYDRSAAHALVIYRPGLVA